MCYNLTNRYCRIGNTYRKEEYYGYKFFKFFK
nr:MAG TPA: hypothetical protein [Caudoviricetes sp.]